jgi:arginyl-tRNA synthetase
MKKEVVDVLKKAIKKSDFSIRVSRKEIESKIETSPRYERGDYSFPCFFLAEKLKRNPNDFALDIRRRIGNPPIMDFESINVEGAYINFFLNKKQVAKRVLNEILSKKDKYGSKKFDFHRRKKIIIEFSSPNIAKPFGVGHLRSTIIGNSLANISEKLRYKVKRINYMGDWGTQFGKLICGFKQWGSLEKLNEGGLRYLEKIYVRVSKNKNYEDLSRYWFKQLEEGEKNSVKLWKIFTELSMKEFKKIYRFFRINFDEYLFESLYNKKMEIVVEELNKKGLLKKSKGALIVDLNKYNLGVALIKKSDDATLYITRDLASAIDRYKKYSFDLMIYEVGQEQELHFKQVFKILELMGYKWAKNCIHVSHGLYLDKDKKKFSTRKGKTIYIEDIINKTEKLVEKEIKKRDSNIKENELKKRIHDLTLSSIFYGDLKNNRSNNIIFNLDNFVSFEGDTGPYILYSYARASSIIRKKNNKRKFEITSEFNPKESRLIKKLKEYPLILEKSFEYLNPSIIANYVFKLSQLFNEFYHECPVIGTKEESFRLTLVDAVRQVIKNSMDLLGIKVLEEM